MCRRLLVVPLLLALCLPADAETPTTPHAVADAVVKAHGAKDAKALAKLAGAVDPDPWRVALVLLGRGQRDAAGAYAAAVPADAPRTAGLAKAVAAYPPEAQAKAWRAAIEAARAKHAAGNCPSAVSELEAEALAEATGLLQVERLALLARARCDAIPLGDGAAEAATKAADAFEAAAKAAAAIGWLEQASALYYEAGLALWGIRREAELRRMESLFEAQGAVETRLHSNVGRGRARFRVAVARVQRGAAAEAREPLREALELLEAGGDREYWGRALGQLADLLDLDGDAEGAFARSCAGSRLLDGDDVGASLPARFRPDPDNLAYDRMDSWLACAAYGLKAGKMDAAAAYAKRAQEALASFGGDERYRLEVAAAMHVYDAFDHARRGRPLEAIDALNEAASHYRTLQLARHEADVMIRLAYAQRDVGNVAEAARLADRAVAQLAQVGTSVDVARARTVAGEIAVAMGDTAKAESHLAEAQGICSKAAGCELHVSVLHALGELAHRRGHTAQAVAHYRKALQLARTSGARAVQGTARERLALMLGRLGNLQEAAELLEEALADFEAVGADGYRALSLTALADLRIREGDHTAAREALEHALAVFERGGVAHGKLRCRQLLVLLAVEDRKYEEAAAHARKARELAKTMGDEDARVLATVNLGRALFLDKKSKDAGPFLKEAAKALGDVDDVEVRVTVRHHLADVRFNEGNDRAAMDHVREALEDAERYGLGLAEGADAGLRGALLQRVYRRGIQAALGAEDPDALYQFLEKSRASTLVAALGGAASLKAVHVSPELRQAERSARAALTHAQTRMRRARRRFKKKEKDEAKAAVRAATRDLELAVTAIRNDVRSRADLSDGEVTPLAAFQKTLSDGDVALMFFREYTATSKAAHYMVLRIDTKARTLHDLGPAAAIDDQRAALFAGGDQEVDAKAAEALRGLLFDTLPLRGVRRLWISPGEALSAVPFAMLQLGCFDVTLVPSITTAALLRENDKPGAKAMLAVGNPNYASLPMWPQLPGSQAEIDAITREGDRTLTLDDATRAGFTEAVAEVERWLAVHFACHGKVDYDNAMRSALILTPDGDSGELTSRAVFSLQIPADLVVLSGCQTGLGQVIEGDGLTGLMRAFMQAGAPRVICSLWKVDDAATSALMIEFYRQWRDGGVSPARALRRAQQHVRSQPQWRDPKYWGAWVLWGLPE